MYLGENGVYTFNVPQLNAITLRVSIDLLLFILPLLCANGRAKVGNGYCVSVSASDSAHHACEVSTSVCYTQCTGCKMQLASRYHSIPCVCVCTRTRYMQGLCNDLKCTYVHA
jgi:hypothetical protein